MRRTPKQQRSKLIVRDIVQAARQHLEDQGLAGFTTSAVAKKTGVSVGSMYQYFENKEQLLDSVALALADEVKGHLDLIVGAEINSNFREFSHTLIASIIEYVNANSLLIRSLLHSDGDKRINLVAKELEGHFTDLFRHYALQHHAELPNTQLPSAVFVAFTSIFAVALRLQLVNIPFIDQESIVTMLVESSLASVFGANYQAEPSQCSPSA